jgi:hypothetical protein
MCLLSSVSYPNVPFLPLVCFSRSVVTELHVSVETHYARVAPVILVDPVYHMPTRQHTLFLPHSPLSSLIPQSLLF